MKYQNSVKIKQNISEKEQFSRKLKTNISKLDSWTNITEITR